MALRAPPETIERIPVDRARRRCCRTSGSGSSEICPLRPPGTTNGSNLLGRVVVIKSARDRADSTGRAGQCQKSQPWLLVSGAGRAGLLRGAHFINEAGTIHAERPSAAPALTPRPPVTVCFLLPVRSLRPLRFSAASAWKSNGQLGSDAERAVAAAEEDRDRAGALVDDRQVQLAVAVEVGGDEGRRSGRGGDRGRGPESAR